MSPLLRVPFITSDANFNVTAAVEDTTGAPVVERYNYTPYGEVTFLDASFANPSSTSAIGNEFLYTGRRRDPETGLQYSRRRYYHPPLGRWLTQDPIGYDGGWNLYAYVDGAPIVAVDPSGTLSKKECEKCVAACLKDGYTKALIDRIKSQGCAAPLIHCVKCDSCGNTESAGKISIISLCYNQGDRCWINGKDLCGTLQHELIHALDLCGKKESELTCPYLMCTEIRAYACTKQCHKGGRYRRPNESQIDC